MTGILLYLKIERNLIYWNDEEILLIQILYFNSGYRFCKHNRFLISINNTNNEQNEFIQKYLKNEDCGFISCISKNKLLKNLYLNL